MRNQQVQKGTAQFQTQRANARHRPTFPHTNCDTIPFFDVRNNVQTSFPSFRWSSPPAPHGNPSPSHSDHCPTTGEVSLATIAHWLRNQLMCASRQARVYDRNAVCDGPHLSLVAGSSCNLPFAAAGGRLMRRCSQVPVLVLAYDVGRLEQECTELRARFTSRGHSVADQCCPSHNHTCALVRKASSQECRKEQ